MDTQYSSKVFKFAKIIEVVNETPISRGSLLYSPTSSNSEKSMSNKITEKRSKRGKTMTSI